MVKNTSDDKERCTEKRKIPRETLTSCNVFKQSSDGVMRKRREDRRWMVFGLREEKGRQREKQMNEEKICFQQLLISS